MSEPSLRFYQPGDEVGIVRLFDAVFPTSMDLARWRWKNAANPAGFPLIAVAVDGSRVVGHACLHPVEVEVQGRRLRAAQGVDMMVDPRYRGRWLIARLDDLAVHRCLKTGYAEFSFGFPVPRFRPYTTRVLGYRRAFTPSQLVKLLNPAYLLRHLVAATPARQARLRQLGGRLAWLRGEGPVDDGRQPAVGRLTHFDARFDRLWEEVRSQFEVAVVRNRRYLSWRYAGTDYVILTVAEPDRAHGFLVLGTVPWRGWRVGLLADGLARDGRVARRLLRAAMRVFRGQRVDLVRCWAMDHTAYGAILRRMGFLPRPALWDLMVRSHSPGASLAVLLERRNWHLTMGDSDGV